MVNNTSPASDTSIENAVNMGEKKIMLINENNIPAQKNQILRLIARKLSYRVDLAFSADKKDTRLLRAISTRVGTRATIVITTPSRVAFVLTRTPIMASFFWAKKDSQVTRKYCKKTIILSHILRNTPPYNGEYLKCSRAVNTSLSRLAKRRIRFLTSSTVMSGWISSTTFLMILAPFKAPYG